MKQCPFCAGVIPDASTICKHCKQSIPSARAGGRRSGSVVGAARDPRRDHRDWRSRRVFWMRMGTPARRRDRHGPPGPVPRRPPGRAEHWRRGQAVREPDRRGRRVAQAEGRAGRKTPSGSTPGRWRRSSRAAGLGIAKIAVGLDWRPAPQAAPRTGRDRPPQPADAGVRHDGQADRRGQERSGHQLAAADRRHARSASRATCRWARARSWRPGRSWGACG